MKSSQMRQRITNALGIFFLLFAVVCARLGYLAVIRGPEFRALALRQHIQRVFLPPERGEIRDRNGDLLALTADSADIFVRPRALIVREPLVPVFANILHVSPRVLSEKISSSEQFVFLARGAKPEQAAAISALGLQGVGVDSTRQRIYPRGTLAGQVVGFAGIDQQGLSGIEQSLNHYLKGERGSFSIGIDGHGRPMDREHSLPPSTLGAHVELTLDSGLQQVAETELESAVLAQGAAGGVAIVMDPGSGEILAMANVPRFDPVRGHQCTKEQWANPAVELSYEPGSTFKGILAAAAIEAATVRPDERIFCGNGHYAVGKRTIHDHNPYGWLTFADVIKHSSNVGAAKVGETLGSERFYATIRSFGFGQRSGIELPGEGSGLVRPLNKWGRIHLVTTSFGQGISVSPLQLLRAYSAIANGGALMRPLIVRKIVAGDGTVLVENRPEVVARPISQRSAAIVTDMLRGVVDEGTATKAKLPGISVAGKTGTAQKVDPKTGRYHPRDRISSFVGFFPAEAPRFAMLVLIDSPKGTTYGGLIAAPVFQRIATYAVEKAGLRIPEPIAPWQNEKQVGAQLVSWAPSDVTRGMPSFIGLSMREALVQAARAGWDVDVDGSGYVFAQEPPAGTDSIQGRKLRLRFRGDRG